MGGEVRRRSCRIVLLAGVFFAIAGTIGGAGCRHHHQFSGPYAPNPVCWPACTLEVDGTNLKAKVRFGEGSGSLGPGLVYGLGGGFGPCKHPVNDPPTWALVPLIEVPLPQSQWMPVESGANCNLATINAATNFVLQIEFNGMIEQKNFLVE